MDRLDDRRRHHELEQSRRRRSGLINYVDQMRLMRIRTNELNRVAAGVSLVSEFGFIRGVGV